jgi:predicted transcriptional regulator of viral defense system
MKKKSTVRTGEVGPVLGITASQERDLLHRLSASGWIVRLKRGVYLVPPRLPAGGKFSPGIGLILKKLIWEQKGRYQISGPSAFNLYGFVDQLVNIAYVYNNRISGSRRVGSLSFRFIKIVEERLGGIRTVRSKDGAEIIYSSKARTLMDAVYDWSRFRSLPRGYDWIRREVERDPKVASRLADMVVEYGNIATARRVGYLLDKLGQPSRITRRIQRRLSDSGSLIPWIPGKPARGRINRVWGIIDNG